MDVAGKFVDKLREQGLAKQTVYDRYMKVVSFLKWCDKTYGVKRVAEMAMGHRSRSTAATLAPAEIRIRPSI